MSSQKKNKAIALRRRGYSLAKISAKLDISKSTASLWLRSIKMPPPAKNKLARLVSKARHKGGQTRHKERLLREGLILARTSKLYWHLDKSKTDYKYLAALLYWCEGEKNTNAVRFTNSDPNLVKLFLKCLRRGFDLDNKKFRACLHLHSYHNKAKQIKHWSRITNIPAKQFLKIYEKTNTAKRVKNNYPGCVSIRYHDVNIAIELSILQKNIIKNGGLV